MRCAIHLKMFMKNSSQIKLNNIELNKKHKKDFDVRDSRFLLSFFPRFKIPRREYSIRKKRRRGKREREREIKPRSKRIKLSRRGSSARVGNCAYKSCSRLTMFLLPRAGSPEVAHDGRRKWRPAHNKMTIRQHRGTVAFHERRVTRITRQIPRGSTLKKKKRKPLLFIESRPISDI